MAWFIANWQWMAGVLGGFLGLVALVLHKFRVDSVASTLDDMKKVIDQLSGGQPPAA